MRIFLSYRRQDSASHVGRLSDALAIRYGDKAVFSDFVIRPGVDWRHSIEDALLQCDFVLVVMGPTWIEATYRDGSERRIDDPRDQVRTEIAIALARGKALIPVLVGGAQLPPRGSLPDVLAPLADLQSVSLGDATWTRDIAELTRRLERKEASWWARWLPWKQ